MMKYPPTQGINRHQTINTFHVGKAYALENQAGGQGNSHIKNLKMNIKVLNLRLGKMIQKMEMALRRMRGMKQRVMDGRMQRKLRMMKMGKNRDKGDMIYEIVRRLVESLQRKMENKDRVPLAEYCIMG